MSTIIYLLQRFGAFLTFFVLQIICFVFIVRYNDQQGKIFWSSVNRVSGGVLENFDQTVRYFHLRDDMDSLAAENARLIELLANAEIDTSAVAQQITSDSFRQVYTVIPCKVISNSVNRKNNTLTLNCGEEDGVLPHRGVVSAQGVVGVIQKVSPHYAQVMSILHRNFKISALLKKNGTTGSLVWMGEDPSIMRLESIPRHETIQKGDTVQTTIFSGLYPTGIDIGVIESFGLEVGNYAYNIDVKLFEDMTRLDYVYVINNLDKEELDQLENESGNE